MACLRGRLATMLCCRCRYTSTIADQPKVLVTGGAKGIGLGIVQSFLEQNAQVVYADIQESEGSLLGFGSDSNPTKPSVAHFVRCDAAHAGQIEAAVKQTIEILGGLDVLVNNVGAHAQPAGLPCHEMSVESLDQVLGINLRSHFLFSKFALREAFVPQRSGCIVNIGSVHGFQNAPGVPAYAAAKGGIVSLTRQLAVEYAPHGIRVTCVVPGTINTPMNRNFMTAEDEATDRSPLGRWGHPREVADAVVFLSGPKSSFITGECLTVDGGLLAKGAWADNETPGLLDQT